MSRLLKLTWVELKLLVREPLTLIFSLALPLLLLFVCSEVFGTDPGDEEPWVWRSVAPTEYYLPAYISLSLATIGVLTLPLRLATYREQGILRRFRASAVPAWVVFGSQALAGAMIGLAGSVLLTIASVAGYGSRLPESLPGVVAAFVLGTAASLALGALLGGLLPTARAAQGAGVMLFFVVLFLSGSGPPLGVMSEPLRRVSDVLPSTHVMLLLQDSWLGFGWSVKESLIVSGVLAAATALSVRLFRWE